MSWLPRVEAGVWWKLSGVGSRSLRLLTALLVLLLGAAVSELVASAAPQAYVASLEYNHRLTPSWSFKASQVHRSGSREFLVANIDPSLLNATPFTSTS